jgi:hypothetical protein
MASPKLAKLRERFDRARDAVHQVGLVLTEAHKRFNAAQKEYTRAARALSAAQNSKGPKHVAPAAQPELLRSQELDFHDGWGWVTCSARRHYYRLGRSLCGEVSVAPGSEPDTTPPADEKRSNCLRCTRELAREEKAKKS